MISLVLAAFFLSPGLDAGLKPVELSGDMRADWTNHAAAASVCVTPQVPSYNILESWHKLGARILKRVAFDPEESAEHFRRNAGLLAVHEGADGVWLVGREKFSPSWTEALAEAEKDVEAALYAKELAEKTVDMRVSQPDLWMAGRHVLWQLQWMDFEMENLDTLRLEFLCYARQLEQLLKLPKRNLPFEVSKPSAHPDRARFVPFEGKDVQAKSVSLVPKKEEPLAPGLSFWRSGADVGFIVESSKPVKKDVWPGGGFTVKFYLPGKDGTWLPYEWTADLSPVAPGRAPSDAFGLWFGRERWGKGVLHRYQDPKPWRMKVTYRGSRSPDYPHIRPNFKMEWTEKGGWKATLTFTWYKIYHQWPSVRTGSRDRWYVGLSGSKEIPDAYVRIDWPAGREANFKTLAGLIDYEGFSRNYESEMDRSINLYYLGYLERLYDFVKTPEPTWHRGDRESDMIFCERVVRPLVDANANSWKLVFSDYFGKYGSQHSPTTHKQTDAVKMAVWKSLGKLLDLSYRTSVLRRDYLLGRAAGKLPPEPPKKKPKEGAAAITEPDVDNDDNAIKLDEEVF